MTFAMATLIWLLGQQPLPEALPAGQLAGAAGAATAAPQAAPGGQQLPAVQIEEEQDVGAEAFDVQVVDGQLRDLLVLIAQSYGLNLAMDPDIGGTVNEDLRGVRLDEALEILLEPRGLEYEIEGRVLRVREPRMETRTFEFDYITTQRTLSRSLNATATAGGGLRAGANVGGAIGGALGGAGGGTGSTSLQGNEQTTLLDDVEADLQTLISGDEATLTFNRMAGIVRATDFRANLDAIGNYLELVETAVQRQVVIEARIVEVKLSEDFQAGIDWSAVLGNSGIVSQSFGAGQGGFNYSASHENFTALLQALSRQGTVNVLQRSSLATVNNQPAVLRVGTQDVFFTTTTQVDPRTGTIVQTATTPSTINEGVVLDVTPQISSDGIITMNIHPTVTERTGQATSREGDTVPIVDVRETDVVARVADGDTVVLAGLISDRTIENISKVPLLGDIPVLGGLFRRVEEEIQKSDLVVLLSPRIMTIQNAGEYARQRIEEQEQLRRQVD